MPISVTCHSCGKKLKAKDALAGRKVACPNCKATLVVESADEDAAALLLDGEAPTEPVAPAPTQVPRHEDDTERMAPEAPPHRPAKKAAADVRSLPPLTAKEPPLWLRHLHWLLVLFLIPLAMSLMQKREEKDFIQRLIETIEKMPANTQGPADKAFEKAEDGKESLEKIFAMLPDHKLEGAWLPRDTWKHWLITLGAAVLFFAFLLGLSLEGSAEPHKLLAVGLFTATVGIFFLLAVQYVAIYTRNIIVSPGSIIGIVFWIVKLIGFSYEAALEPDNGFFLSFLGFTFGVGLCEELVKAAPIIVQYHQPNKQSWRGAYLWGLASGAGFGLSEAISYSSDFYNGISGPGIYIVRNVSCVALHALWTGSAAITIHHRQHLFQGDLAWHDWLVRALAVVAVPMVLHGLYDTLLKKELNALALAVAVASFVFLAFQISRLRGGDDEAAHKEMLREYQRRRKAMRT